MCDSVWLADGDSVQTGAKMTDFVAEQADEIEALESIFPDTLSIVSEGCFRLPVEVEVGEFDEVSFDVSFLFEVTHVAEYPDVIPGMALRDVIGLNESAQEEIMAKLTEEAEENIGMPMAFTLHALCLEWAEEKAEHNMDFARTEKERIAQEEADAELARLTAGTIVTKESFAEWRAGYEAEQAAILKANPVKKKVVYYGNMTGKQMFFKDAKLITSDEALVPPDADGDGDDDGGGGGAAVDMDFGDMDLGDLDDELDGMTDDDEED